MTARFTAARPRLRRHLAAALAASLLGFAALYSAMLLGEARSRAEAETAAALPWIAALLPTRAASLAELQALMAQLAAIRHVSVELHDAQGTLLAQAPTTHVKSPGWLPTPQPGPEKRLPVQGEGGDTLAWFTLRAAPADELAELWADYTRSLALMAALAVLSIAALLTFSRLSNAVDAAEGERQALLRKALALDEQTRRALAHDLHDEASPYLVALQPMTAALERACLQRPEAADLAPRVAALAAHQAHALTTLRRVLAGLHPPALQALGLPAALTQLARGGAAVMGVDADVQLDLRGRWDDLGALLDAQVYRMVQECLTNALRHGGRRVEAQLVRSPTQLTLTLTNDCAAAPLPAASIGLGTLGLQERCLALGGHCRSGPISGSVHGGTATGWRVHITLPLEGAPHGH